MFFSCFRFNFTKHFFPTISHHALLCYVDGHIHVGTSEVDVKCRGIVVLPVKFVGQKYIPIL